MKIADLYIRVSTDEQADKGYSLRDQEERLRRYCEIQSISVRRVIQEDFSAKTFERPAWKALMLDLKKNSNHISLVLFTKWDRFSRNAGDAYQMIGKLRKLGVEPQAVEQPLDLSVPENKMMLAFYLAAPEVENDRRALNTLNGMRRARKEGRYMGVAPNGYLNKVTETGKKYIAPVDPTAGIIKWVFEQIALDLFTTEQIWKEAQKRGLKCNKKNFWVLVRNPVYMGKIFVSKWKDEEAQLVDGLHEAIISEALFYEVQDVLDGRKKTQRTKIKVDESMPLRGFLMCPKCFRSLTGSRSRGKSGNRYSYYHCTTACGCRYSSDKANELFVNELRKYTILPAVAELYVEKLCECFEKTNAHNIDEQRRVKVQLDQAYSELNTARSLVMKGQIGPDDFQVMKKICEDKIARLQAQIIESDSDQFDLRDFAKSIADATSRLDQLYIEAPIDHKRELVSSIFPEKLTFDGNEYRTPRVNEVIRLMCSIDKGFEGIKKGVHLQNSMMYPEVTLGVHFSNNFRHDCRKLALTFNKLVG